MVWRSISSERIERNRLAASRRRACAEGVQQSHEHSPANPRDRLGRCVGRAVVAELLARGHTVVGYDRVADPAASVKVVGTLEDAGQLQSAAAGANAIIHLAAAPDNARYPRGEAPDDGDNFLSDLVPSNVIGPYQVLEAARKLKVPRVVLASTGQVIDGHLKAGNVPVTPESPPRPRFLYACTKVFLEALGSVYAREYGIEVLAVRLGWCPRAGQEEEFRDPDRAGRVPQPRRRRPLLCRDGGRGDAPAVRGGVRDQPARPHPPVRPDHQPRTAGVGATGPVAFGK